MSRQARAHEEPNGSKGQGTSTFPHRTRSSSERNSASTSRSSQTGECNGDYKSWCFVSTPPVEKRKSSAPLATLQSNMKLQNIDELSCKNLALLSLINRPDPINSYLVTQVGLPSKGSNHVHHHSASRCASEDSVELGGAWAVVSDVSSSDHHSDLLAMGAWAQGDVVVDSSVSRSRRS
ncbi:hypothetical protein HJFPF1_00904 [Paramyrothecium foliicola]|nr:hypothetical protein HJFPF1_00904 [Paramyrothecium foliicola]